MHRNCHGVLAYPVAMESRMSVAEILKRFQKNQWSPRNAHSSTACILVKKNYANVIRILYLSLVKLETMESHGKPSIPDVPQLGCLHLQNAK